MATHIKKNQINIFQTVLVIVTGLSVIFYVTDEYIFLYLVIAIGVLSSISTSFARVISAGWMKLAEWLGMIMPNIILGIVFYLILTPIALLSRLFGEKDPLNLNRSEKSLFHQVNTTFERSFFERMW